MSHAEALGWAEYIRRRGSLNVGMRVEQGVAMLMALIVNRSGGNKGQPVSANQYLIHRDPEKPVSLAEAMRDWK